MRILIVTQTFPPRLGGMQSVMSSLALKFSKRYSTIVFPDHFLPQDHYLRNSSIQYNFTNYPKIIRSLIKKNKINEILKNDDVIICDSWKSLKAIPKNNNKVIMLAHGQELLSKSNQKKFIKLVGKVTNIIPNSNFTKDLIVNISYSLKSKIKIIPPTYEISDDKFNIKKNRTINKKIHLITISRLEERKGFVPLIKALKILLDNEKINCFEWSIYGKGEFKKDIENSIIDNQLTKFVKLKGFINDKKKHDVLMNSDLFLMPSYQVNNSIEGFGISYIEAAKYGIPSISGIEGGVKDAVINKKSGWNVNPLDEKKLVKVLFTAITNHTLRKRFGENARKLFVEEFASEKVFGKLMGIVKSSF